MHLLLVEPLKALTILQKQWGILSYASCETLLEHCLSVKCGINKISKKKKKRRKRKEILAIELPPRSGATFIPGRAPHRGASERVLGDPAVITVVVEGRQVEATSPAVQLRIRRTPLNEPATVWRRFHARPTKTCDSNRANIFRLIYLSTLSKKSHPAGPLNYLGVQCRSAWTTSENTQLISIQKYETFCSQAWPEGICGACQTWRNIIIVTKWNSCISSHPLWPTSQKVNPPLVKVMQLERLFSEGFFHNSQIR